MQDLAAGETEFCVLGPLAVRAGTVVIQVPRGKQRAVLAALLMAVGRVVSLDELAETLWGSAPPPTARVAVQNHVMRLRKTLGGEGWRVMTQPPGYLIKADPGELDVTLFRARLDAARVAARDNRWGTAATAAQAALSLWRDEPLADVDSETLMLREAPLLAELRLQALETLLDAGLHLGRHSEVITELRRLTSTHPLRERLHGQLMLALYRDGRQAEALAAYQQARDILITELGAEPGSGLRDLQQRILSGDSALHLARPPQPGQAGPKGTIPRELPPEVPGFTGRAAELAALARALDRPAEGRPVTVVISAIGGTAGVGKTALAVQCAHAAAGRFPDGQLYVNLRGYDPDQPMPAADALAGFLRSLGVPGQDIPPGQDERAARYRSLLADRKLLIVLDNAASADQVRPLLPGMGGCAVVVTSRDSLAGLVARHGATRLDLDLLPLPDALGLLRDLIGTRVDDDPGAAGELAAQCCRLPLALRVAAELAAARPGVPLAGLAGELADRQRRLDLLEAGGDPRTAVRAVFSWSHRHLDGDAARAFRLAGLHPGTDVDAYAVAALTGMTLTRARTVLDVLARAYLIQPCGPGRYGMHDLLRAYARELAARDGQEEQDASLTRLFDYYLHTASAAMDTLYPAERHRRPRIPQPDTPAPPMSDPAAARAWLDNERPTLVTVARHAAGHSWPAHAIRLSTTLFRHLDTVGHHPEALIIHSHARAAAQHTGDQAAEAHALNHLSAVELRQCHFQQARDHYRQVLALFRQTGDLDGQARALVNLGCTCFLQGRFQQGISFQRQALAICRETRDQYFTAGALSNLGICEDRLGRYDLAARHYRKALAIAVDIGARDMEGSALVNLANVGLVQGQYRQAADYLHHALALSRETGDREVEAEALTRTGELRLRQGHPEEAARVLRAALTLRRELGDLSGEADALIILGEMLVATGQPEHARADYDAALGLATQIGDEYQRARAHHGLGQASQANGDPVKAHSHWQQAHALFTKLGTPEAGQVRAEMACHDYRDPA